MNLMIALVVEAKHNVLEDHLDEGTQIFRWWVTHRRLVQNPAAGLDALLVRDACI